MGSDEDTRSLIAYLQLTHPLADQARKDILGQIVLHTLVDADKPLGLGALRAAVASQYDLAIHAGDISAAVSLLRQKNRVEQYGSGFRLTGSERAVLSKARQDFEAIRSEAERAWLDSVASTWKIDDLEKRRALLTALREFLSQACTSYARDFLLAYKGDYAETEKDFVRLIRTLSQQYSRSIKELEIRRVLESELVNLFRNANEAQAKYLYSLFFGSLAMAYLGLPEDMRNAGDAELHKTRLYIDSNVIFSLLGCHLARDEMAIREMMRLSVSLNVSVCVSRITLNEMKRVLSDARERINEILRFGHSLEPAVTHALGPCESNPFVRKFFGQPNTSIQSWDEFYSTYSLGRLEEWLSEKRIVVVEDEEQYEELRQSAEYPNLLSLVEEAAAEGKGKGTEAVRHDAYLILRVMSIRSDEPSSGLFGARTWLISTDRHLPTTRDLDLKVPVVIWPDRWLQLVWPFVSPSALRSLDRVFGALISSAFTTVDYGSFPAFAYGEWVKEVKDPNLVRRIVGTIRVNLISRGLRDQDVTAQQHKDEVTAAVQSCLAHERATMMEQQRLIHQLQEELRRLREEVAPAPSEDKPQKTMSKPSQRRTGCLAVSCVCCAIALLLSLVIWHVH